MAKRSRRDTRLPAVDGANQRWLPIFLEYVSHMSISSKELVGHERQPLANILYRAQRQFLEQVCIGLDQGIHDFKCLKARQLGISTISLAVDVFWLSVHDKLQGALVTDTEPNREKFRVLLEQYIESLPKGLRVGIRRHNRNLLELNNGSCLDYLVAGTKRSNTTLGQSRALNFLHATEVGSWASDEGIASLRASLAQKHPDRLYLWESTAHGYNHWHDLYGEAAEDIMTQKAFFIGWYMKEDYAFAPGSKEFLHYWDDRMDDEEIRLCHEVKDRYGYDISPGQIAWHRWYRTTQLPNEDLMNQNFPWTPEQAFILSGSSFFPLRKVAENINFIKTEKPLLKGYRYHMGNDFLATEIEQVDGPAKAELKVWEEPHPLGVYAMGVDPAYGRGEENDNHAIQLVRCYADKVIQVAEYATNNPETYQLTWVMAHIAGAYKNVCINLEVQGPGGAIMQELRHLKQLCDMGVLSARAAEMKMTDVFDNVRWYLYHRPDSMSGNYVYNFVTSQATKQTLMNQLRDNYALGLLRVRSLATLHEMEKVVQDGSEIGASGKNHDDRTYALGLANKAYVDRLRAMLIANNQTYDEIERQERVQQAAPQATFMAGVVASFFKGKETERERREIDKVWKDAGVIV
ncbi:MAG TPA: hypothetical protein VF848_04240 [Steroidobacteraceae bacterium]